MINLFCGYDERESVGFHVFAHSVLKHATQPVHITPLTARGMPQGSNAFTFSRFLIPHLMGHKGHAIFMDGSDMLLTEDIANLDELFDPSYAVQVVKHDTYETRHRRKYVGTSMECDNRDYPLKNWASVMIINCEHEAWRLINKYSIALAVETGHALDLLQFIFMRSRDIGELPDKWNVLADEGHDTEGAACLHWTAGIPGFPMYANAPCAREWWAANLEMNDRA